ncbi:MAG: non-canonical purine NTP diphosphatase [Bacteroidales bacterium]|jgi:XTP/dITP diphosphohydrolase|nr:non-canonical purine NTP diphosphatase [Bacteroidales bacterium]
MKLVFASNNKHKLEEVRQLVDNQHIILSLSDIDCYDEIPEESPDLEGNALQKARYVAQKYHLDCFADDTGLEVAALDGRPGVFSARYAGEACSFEDNMQKLLLEMKNIADRKARFRTVIALIINQKEYIFEGKVEGEILTDKRGNAGFGYDPIFLPTDSHLSFGEMPLEMKNQFSHRAKALEKLMSFLQNYPTIQ